MAQQKDSPKVKRSANKTKRGLQPGGLNARRNGIARQKARDAREAERLEFRHRQANMAKELVDDLTGLARKVAVMLIDFFPEAQATETVSKTDRAEQKMRALLLPQEVKRPEAVALGVRKARLALREAYQGPPLPGAGADRAGRLTQIRPTS